MKGFFQNPYTVMGVVLAMYAVKVAVKLIVGHEINSPVLIGDGFHNAADIFEALLVIATIFFSRLPDSTRYPFGRKNIESLFSVAVGLGLCLMALRISLDSIVILGRLGAYWIGFAEQTVNIPLKMGGPYGWLAAGVMLGSALLSINVSAYQVRIGRKTGHQALVADGEETRSDGLIETAAFAGICGQYLFGVAWMEYVIALVIAGFMVRTGWEIFHRGLGALLQRSIGDEHEAAIRQIVERVPGVRSVAQIKTFQTGEKVIIILKLITMSDAHAQRLLKHGMVPLIAGYLAEQEFRDGEFFIRFDRPDAKRYRTAIALRKVGDGYEIADGIADATHVAVCDHEFGKIVRVTIHPAYLQLDDLVRFLAVKRVRTLFVFNPELDQDRIPNTDIELAMALSFVPASLGM